MADGHSGSCERATVGSVCHCPCSGVRHSVVTLAGLEPPASDNPPASSNRPPAAEPVDSPAPAADPGPATAPDPSPGTPTATPTGTPTGTPSRTGDTREPPATPADDTDRVRRAFADILADRGLSGPNHFVMLSTVRDRAGLTQAEFEAAVRRLRREAGDDVWVVPESNQRALTDEQRAAAIIIGNQPRHLISITADVPPDTEPAPAGDALGGNVPAGGRPDIASLVGRGLLGAEISDDDARRLREEVGRAVNGTYAGLTVEVSGVGGSQAFTGADHVVFSAVIRDADGEQVGVAERALYRDENGDLVANHMLLQLDPSVQGRGFAREFNGALTEWYRENGVSRIQLDANIDVGGMAWAVHGYDFESPSSARRIERRLQIRADSYRYDGQTDQADAAQAILQRMRDEPFGSPGYPTPYEISQVGRTPGATTWLGRDTMLGSYWTGVRWLQ